MILMTGKICWTESNRQSKLEGEEGIVLEELCVLF